MALAIICNNPPSGFFGVLYSHAFPASGDVPPDVFATIAGALPNGLALDAATGIVSGTPTVAATFNFTIQVTDSLAAVASVACSIVVPGCPKGAQGV